MPRSLPVTGISIIMLVATSSYKAFVAALAKLCKAGDGYTHTTRIEHDLDHPVRLFF